MSLTNRSIGKTCKEVNAMLVLYLLQTEAGFFPFFRHEEKNYFSFHSAFFPIQHRMEMGEK